MLAHELRNPLAPIRNGLQVHAAGRTMTAGHRAGPYHHGAAAAAMVRLVDDLLDVSRISQGKLQLRKERVDLATRHSPRRRRLRAARRGSWPRT